MKISRRAFLKTVLTTAAATLALALTKRREQGQVKAVSECEPSLTGTDLPMRIPTDIGGGCEPKPVFNFWLPTIQG